ncbi:MAG: cytochrome c oxidase subunit II [Gammaproteobacteria bacterium]|nr:cytochrome c oxidase subunit II [Gammaproteobacteria bacterium]NIN62992.1 cytochrome c oxidase subunit II [Gammaproteobacteria bacterium]NIO63288.1 cytochrome c oxidase subunit II [Gammaproteobacteria bacterium]NIP49993.1 cytochrome c oxidase subunit II [Gammaproteobacteria bacterium]NIQ12212.1 cytochrome c oxidase subunit II [Gammaproteobacteria bacterium]
MFSLLWAGTVSAEWGLNMTPGVTPISREVYDLHMLILYIVTAIGIIVFGVMFWSIIYHRKSKGAVAKQFHHNTFAEIAWTIIPILILVAMAIPATKTLIKMEQTGDAEITVKITGYQWKWKYDYLEDGLSFYSVLAQDSNEARQVGSSIDPAGVDHYLLDVDEPIVLPVGKKVRLLTTAADVIHAWWVPALGWKRDAIPGFINDNWAVIEEPGTYRGQCAELCGKDHGFMPIVLKAVPEAEYVAWVEEKKAEAAARAASGDKEYSMEELMVNGEDLYNKNCASCHMANGQGVPGVFPSLLESQLTITSEGLAEHIDRIINGKGLMPAFGEQLSDADIAAVVTYERNAWGIDTGDIVQPADIKAAR